MITVTTELEYVDGGLIRICKPIAIDDTMVYPLIYPEGLGPISPGEQNILIVKFPRTKAPFGINTKAHLLSLSLGKDYENNPTWDHLTILDACLETLVTEKIPGGQYVPMVQFSKIMKDGELVENREYGPHYTLGLQRAGTGYKVESDSHKGKFIEGFDLEGTIHPQSSVSTAAVFRYLVKKPDGTVTCRPKLLKYKVHDDVDATDIEFQDVARTFELL